MLLFMESYMERVKQAEETEGVRLSYTMQHSILCYVSKKSGAD